MNLSKSIQRLAYMISAKWFNDWAMKSAFLEPNCNEDVFGTKYHIKSVDNYDLL
jgi:hypothetical protein